jgi:hypothetical protein
MAYGVWKASSTTAETALTKQNHLWSFQKNKNHLYLRIYHSVPQQAVTPQAASRSK